MEDAGIDEEGNFRPGSRLQLAEEALKLGQVQSSFCGLAVRASAAASFYFPPTTTLRLPTVEVVAPAVRGQQTLGGSILRGRCVCVHTLVFHMLCYNVLYLLINP